ncbi:MAG TPA: metal ABC transporter permease [Acidimicrobiales bacterium]|nr:metal ABC transporter permease [Acidimicrobiales bacterium]
MQPLVGISNMLLLPFMVHAFVAGGVIALASGLVGYFLVLRNQVFTGDALSHVAFTGALGALALGIDLRYGLYLGCVGVALLMGFVGRRAVVDDVVIGNVFSFVLGIGVFFLAIYATQSQASTNATAGVNVLFGSMFGLSFSQTMLDIVIGLVVIAAVMALGRPLLFSSIDPAVAEARGLPVRALGMCFLLLVGVTAGEATQAVGALLLLGLLATPAGAAQLLTSRPWLALFLSAAIALVSVWSGLVLSYAFPNLPVSFSILALVTVIYCVSWGVALFVTPRHRRPEF